MHLKLLDTIFTNQISSVCFEGVMVGDIVWDGEYVCVRQTRAFKARKGEVRTFLYAACRLQIDVTLNAVGQYGP